MENSLDLSSLTAEEKARQLFCSQKQTLLTFLSNGAITKAQFDKSYGDLMKKMGVDSEGNPVR